MPTPTVAPSETFTETCTGTAVLGFGACDADELVTTVGLPLAPVVVTFEPDPLLLDEQADTASAVATAIPTIATQWRWKLLRRVVLKPGFVTSPP